MEVESSRRVGIPGTRKVEDESFVTQQPGSRPTNAAVTMFTLSIVMIYESSNRSNKFTATGVFTERTTKTYLLITQV